MALPKLTYLTQDSSFVDYRPTIDWTGIRVIFERTPREGGGMTTLQIIQDINSPSAAPFLSGPSPASQTRPDWCWQGASPFTVLFNGAASNKDPVSVWVVDDQGNNPQELPGTQGAAYPRWSLEGTRFVTENTGAAATQKPCNTVFNFLPEFGLWIPSVDGTDTPGRAMYGGMPCVSPSDLPFIAYAGQPVIQGGWVPNYNQGFNYIFINSLDDSGEYISKPLEPKASLTSFDPKYEGRAPDWSRDGSTIAFESNRSGQGYAIYLCNVQTGNVTQVTDPYLNAQHARFFPDGSKLILCAQLNPGTSAMGIAWVDVSGLL